MIELVREALSRIENVNPTTITDDVFSVIQNDRNLMERYLEYLAGGNEELGGKNSKIAQTIAELQNLATTGIENKNPNSILIQHFKEFKRK